jgi:hypothetical protein
MFKHFLKVFCLNGLAAIAYADTPSLYCPQNSGYIKPGMTADQVIAACGSPISQQDSDKPVMQKIPLKQLFFNNQGQSTAFYGVWAIPGGSSNYVQNQYVPFNGNNGGGGSQLEVDIVNEQVHGIKINGGDSNAFSICGGVNISAGDDASKVYNACGTPTLVNNTFINVPIPSKTKPKVWIYQMGQYKPPVTLTFVNGRLVTINDGS